MKKFACKCLCFSGRLCLCILKTTTAGLPSLWPCSQTFFSTCKALHFPLPTSTDSSTAHLRLLTTELLFLVLSSAVACDLLGHKAMSGPAGVDCTSQSSKLFLHQILEGWLSNMTVELVRLIEKLNLLPQSLHCKCAQSFSQAVQTDSIFSKG